MPRTAILSLIAAIIVALAACSGAAGSSSPRGVLTQAEYQEFLSTEKAEAQLGHGAITQIAQRDCNGLTGISRLTRTEHAECEAAFVFFYRFVKFPAVFASCAKNATRPAGRRCLERTTRTFSWSTSRFLTTDSASRSAALQRGFDGRCLSYLVLTGPQKTAMHRLSSGLRSLSHALVTGNALAFVRAAEHLNTDMSVARKALFVLGSVRVCRHE